MNCKDCGKKLNLSKDFISLLNICKYCGRINELRNGGEINGN